MHIDWGTVFKTVAAGGGASASYLLGGWSALLGVLATFVVVDYLTGLLAAAIEGKLSSKVGFIGIAKKVCIFAMVAIAHQVDVALGNAHVFRDATTFFYLANELVSILENSGRIGLPVPEPIKRAVDVLKSKGGEVK